MQDEGKWPQLRTCQALYPLKAKGLQSFSTKTPCCTLMKDAGRLGGGVGEELWEQAPAVHSQGACSHWRELRSAAY
jgi:hypothetical protein